MNDEKNSKRLPDEATWYIRESDLPLVAGGKWLTIDGEVYAVVEVEEKPNSTYSQVHLKRQAAMPENPSGFIKAYRSQGMAGQLLKFTDE